MKQTKAVVFSLIVLILFILLAAPAVAQVGRLQGYKIYTEKEKIDYPVELSEDEWRRRLTDEQYYILREKGTEYAFSGEYDKFYRKGTYYSAATGQPLFSSDAKYDSESGWPSFFKPIDGEAVLLIEDNSLFGKRVEVVDSMSGSHLGHVFTDGPAPTGLRFCMNSASLIFVPEGGAPPAVLK